MWRLADRALTCAVAGVLHSHADLSIVLRMVLFPLAARGSGPHLLSLTDLEPSGVLDVVEHARALKRQRATIGDHGDPLAGLQIALLFDKPSLRTRVSFEVGIQRLGGRTTALSGAEVGLGSREPIADIGRTLARYVDAIVVRMLSHAGMAELADAAGIPVVNALSEHEHPCQALADVMTMQEHLGDLDGRTVAYVGDGNNVCHSLLLAGASAGMQVRVATPAGFEPDAEVVAKAAGIARRTGGRVELTADPRTAVAGADAVYTDVWASMGQEAEAEARRRAFAGFRVDGTLLAGAPDAIVMHCLPAHRGDEIDDETIEGDRSVVFDQAENRLYVQQAVLLRLLRAGRAGMTELWPRAASGPTGIAQRP
jgi:ornithine carbamoyltransferase